MSGAIGGSDARAIGGASLPLLANFAVDRAIFLRNAGWGRFYAAFTRTLNARHGKAWPCHPRVFRQATHFLAAEGRGS
jgi:hypothetical protein